MIHLINLLITLQDIWDICGNGSICDNCFVLCNIICLLNVLNSLEFHMNDVYCVVLIQFLFLQVVYKKIPKFEAKYYFKQQEKERSRAWPWIKDYYRYALGLSACVNFSLFSPTQANIFIQILHQFTRTKIICVFYGKIPQKYRHLYQYII